MECGSLIDCSGVPIPAIKVKPSGSSGEGV